MIMIKCLTAEAGCTFYLIGTESIAHIGCLSIVSCPHSMSLVQNVSKSQVTLVSSFRPVLYPGCKNRESYPAFASVSTKNSPLIRYFSLPCTGSIRRNKYTEMSVTQSSCVCCWICLIFVIFFTFCDYSRCLCLQWMRKLTYCSWGGRRDCLTAKRCGIGGMQLWGRRGQWIRIQGISFCHCLLCACNLCVFSHP